MDQEELTRQQFDRTSRAYSTAPLFVSGQDLQWLLQAASLTPDMTVLDVGCGAGYTALSFAPHVRQVIGVDLSSKMLAAARQNLSNRGVTNVQFQVSSATALPFGDRSFDRVTCRFVAHHFSNLPSALQEIHRVLKPGGRFLAVDVVSPEGEALAAFVNRIEQLRDPSHFWEWQVSQWQTAIAEVGMKFILVKQWWLAIDFVDWVTRQQTAPEQIRELEICLDNAAPEIREALEITAPPQRTFQLWAALLQGIKPAS